MMLSFSTDLAVLLRSFEKDSLNIFGKKLEEEGEPLCAGVAVADLEMFLGWKNSSKLVPNFTL